MGVNHDFDVLLLKRDVSQDTLSAPLNLTIALNWRAKGGRKCEFLIKSGQNGLTRKPWLKIFSE